MKYVGTKPYQIHREDSPIKATLLFETDNEDALRRYISESDQTGRIFRRMNPKTGSWTVDKLRKKGTHRPKKGVLSYVKR